MPPSPGPAIAVSWLTPNANAIPERSQSPASDAIIEERDERVERAGARQERREDEDDPDGRAAGEREHGERSGRYGGSELGHRQERSPVDAVGERAADEVDDDHRPELGGADQADERRGVRQRIDLVGDGDERRLRPEARDDRPGLDDAVVA